MNKRSAVLKMIGYSFATAFAASLISLLVVFCLFGLRLSEREGRVAGLVGTVAGIAGALGGLSIARRRKRPSVFGAMIVPLLITSNSCAADQVVTPNMVGHWEGTGRIIVTWCRQTSLPVTLDVAADGTATGKIGDANLTNGHLKRNRGWIGRKLNLKTDYIITGNLTGPIVAGENIVRSSVTMPVNFRNGDFVGGLHTSGSKFGDKEQMILSAAFLKLTRIPTQ